MLTEVVGLVDSIRLCRLPTHRNFTFNRCRKTQDSCQLELLVKMYEFTLKQLCYSAASVGARPLVSAAVVASVAAVLYWHHICFRPVAAPALRPHKAASVWRSGQQRPIPASPGAWSRTGAAAFSTVAACWSADTQLFGRLCGVEGNTQKKLRGEERGASVASQGQKMTIPWKGHRRRLHGDTSLQPIWQS